MPVAEPAASPNLFMRPPSTRAAWLFRMAFWPACVAVGVLSLMPVEHLPPQVFDIWDKAQHATGFAVLAFLGQRAHGRSLIAIALGLLIYGGVIELAQSATGWRFGDVWDWLADGIGIALGLVLSTRWRSTVAASGHNAQ